MRHQRGKYLKEIINNADFENGKLVLIKTKASHSKWYQSYGGELNTPSLYLTLVPKSVEKEAKELQSIRKKHQNDRKFDFYETDYQKVILRCADHGFADVNVNSDEVEKIMQNGINADELESMLYFENK